MAKPLPAPPPLIFCAFPNQGQTIEAKQLAQMKGEGEKITRKRDKRNTKKK